MPSKSHNLNKLNRFIGNPEDLLPTPAFRIGVNISLLNLGPSGSARRERCLVSSDLASVLGLLEGMQIRVTGSDGSAAVFTVGGTFSVLHLPIAPYFGIRIYSNTSGSTTTDGGVYRLCGLAGGSAALPFTTCTVRNVPVSESTTDGVVTSFYTESASGSFTEHVTRADDQELVALFPHGGNIDMHTSDQVAAFVSQLSAEGAAATLWECRGAWSGGGAFQRWHITADDIDLHSFRGLFMAQYRPYGVSFPGSQICVPFGHAVAFHGFSAASSILCAVVIGGRAALAHKQTVQTRVQEAIAAAAPSTLVYYHVADVGVIPPTSWHGIDLTDKTGTSPDNLVNRICTAGGIQIEQSQAIRNSSILRTAVAQGVATAMAEILANP